MRRKSLPTTVNGAFTAQPSTIFKKQFSFKHDTRLLSWDAMILNSAISLGCDVLWSEDLNVGQTYDGVLLSNLFV